MELAWDLGVPLAQEKKTEGPNFILTFLDIEFGTSFIQATDSEDQAFLSPCGLLHGQEQGYPSQAAAISRPS